MSLPLPTNALISTFPDGGVNEMSRIAVIRITEFDEGSTATTANAFISAAEEAGHRVIDVTTMFSKSCHCGGHCCQRGGAGCGDDDCVCTFAKSVPDCDCVVFAFPVDAGFSPTALNRIIHKVTFNCQKARAGEEKKVFVISSSQYFEEYVFNDAISVVKLECGLQNWSYAGELLIPGLPDACLGADPVSIRQAKRLAEKI